MKYLVDADVLSEATKPQPLAAPLDWLSRHEAELAVNPIVLGELEYGILALPAGRRRKRLLEWFQQGVIYLPVFELDAATSSVWAELLVRLRRKGRAMPVKDSLIAATAIQHNLTIATRNTADYRHSGAQVVNPFASSRR